MSLKKSKSYKFKKILRFLPLILICGSLITVYGVIKNIDKIQTLFGRASGEAANIIVDTQGILGQYNPIWSNLAQGGESATYSYSPISDKIKALSPQYIRIDHIYDFYDIVSVNGGILSFNWEKFDKVIKEITSVGAKPFISLSYMPPAIAENGDITGKPKNWNDWQYLIQKTVEHVSGTNGLNLSNVYYEVWNEPDLFGGWKTYGDKNYLTLYQTAINGAQSAKNVNPFKIGGPATTALYANWISKFYSHIYDNNLRNDFYSWHRYSLDPAQFNKDFELFKKTTRDMPRFSLSTELLITEWGPDSNNNRIYDGNMAAAHYAASVTEMAPHFSKAFAFEIQDGKDPNNQEYWGRWGIITHNDFGAHTKPRYQAIRMFNQLSSVRLSSVGNGSWVRAMAAQKNNSTQVILSNFDVNNTHSELVPITFVRINPGKFNLNTQFLGRNSNSTILATDSARLQTLINMPPNSVVLLELKPL